MTQDDRGKLGAPNAERGPSYSNGYVHVGLVLFSSLCVAFAVCLKPKDRVTGLLGPTKLDLSTEKSPVAAKKASLPSLTMRDVTFPSRLSDSLDTTTVMVAARSQWEKGPTSNMSGVTQMKELGVSPRSSDLLMIEPLPAKNLLEPASSRSRSLDPLFDMALPHFDLTSSSSGRRASRALTAGSNHAKGIKESEIAAPGFFGHYQLQVTSFKEMSEANRFALELRKRGHHAHVQRFSSAKKDSNDFLTESYRVQIGPFFNESSAKKYRTYLEEKEQLIAFIVSPTDVDKVPYGTHPQKFTEKPNEVELKAQAQARGEVLGDALSKKEFKLSKWKVKLKK